MDEYQEENQESENLSLGLDQALDHLKNTLHQMKLQDAIHRQEIRKLEKDNDKSEAKINELKSSMATSQKQKKTDEQYLFKQQEVIVKLEMSEEMAQRTEGPAGGKNTNGEFKRSMIFQYFWVLIFCFRPLEG
jgi:chromosome segregation ATPase